MDSETARATLTLLGFHTGELGTGVFRHPDIKGHVRLDDETPCNVYMSAALNMELARILSRKGAILSWITVEEFLKSWEEYYELRSV